MEPEAQVKARIEAETIARVEELAILDLAAFVCLMWHAIEPETPLAWGRHLDVMCHALQRQAEGDPAYRNLVLLVPPGKMKSILVSVMVPAWEWLHWPGRKSLFVSSTDEFSLRDSRRTREIIGSDAYKRLLSRLTSEKRARGCKVCGKERHVAWEFAVDQNEKANFENTRGGFRQCFGITSNSITGRRGDRVTFDDVLDARKVMKAGTAAEVQTLLDDVDRTMRYVEKTRVNDARTVKRTLIMQRLADGDPAGRRAGMPGWRTICLPMEFDPSHPNLSPEDWRTVPGELLHPERDEPADVEDLKLALPVDYDAQYQQRARRKDGGLFRREHFARRYLEAPAEVAERCDEIAISVDCTFKGSDTSDRVSIQAWGREGPSRFYLLDRDTRRMGFLATVEAIRAMKVKWPRARTILVESAANGPAVIEMLSAEFPGVVPFNPRGSSKAERAKVGALPVFDAGNAWLPSESSCPWVEGYVAEMEAFGPGCANDDDVDATSQLLLRWGSLVNAASAVELPVVVGRAVLETSMVTRWAGVDAGAVYRCGAGVDWRGGYAVVVDEAGEQVARVTSADGPQAFAELLVAEVVYWNMAVTAVGSERPELAHGCGVVVARSGPRVVVRPGASIYDGPRAVFTRSDWSSCWRRLGEAARAGLLATRDGVARSAVLSVVEGAAGVPRGEGGGAMPVEAVAYAVLVATGAGEERMEAAASRPRWVPVKGGGGRGDAWSRTSLVSGARLRG